MKYENISKGAFDAKISDTPSIFFESGEAMKFYNSGVTTTLMT